MESAVDSLHTVVPRVKVAGQLTVQALDAVPLPILFVLFAVCVAIFQWPFSSSPPVLPTASPVRDSKHPRLVSLQSSRQGQFTYLDTLTRQLVVSEKPLLPPSPPLRPKDRCQRLRQALRGYRPPLRCVPEVTEDHAMV